MHTTPHTTYTNSHHTPRQINLSPSAQRQCSCEERVPFVSRSNVVETMRRVSLSPFVPKRIGWLKNTLRTRFHYHTMERSKLNDWSLCLESAQYKHRTITRRIYCDPLFGRSACPRAYVRTCASGAKDAVYGSKTMLRN